MFAPRPVFQCIKALPIVILIARLAFTQADESPRRPMRLRGGGLVASVIGAVLLESSFAAGTLAFIVAQACYGASLRWRALAPPRLLAAGALSLALCLGIIGLVFAALTGPLRSLVPTYAAIEAVALAGGLASWRPYDRSSAHFACGITLFALSDSLLAFSRWYQPLPAADLYVQTTYFLAQYLIALSVLAPAATRARSAVDDVA